MSKEKNDLTLRVFAIIIAFILWTYVMSEVNPERPETIKNIKVSFNNIEGLERQGLVLMEPKEASVSVRVNGRKTDMAKFLQNPSKYLRASVDLSGYGEGQIKVPVNVFLEQFSDVRVERYEPSEILFNFDKLIDRNKSVTLETTGSLEANYILGNLQTKSQTIVLRGPKSWVNEVVEAVALVKLDGRKESGLITVPVRLIDDEGNEVRGVGYEPSVIEVEVPVYRTASLPIELRTENQLPENFEIIDVVIRPSQITLKGDNNIVHLNSIQTQAIDINSLIDNPNVEVELDLPPNVSMVNPNEKINVFVNIEERLTKTFEYSLDEINIKDPAPGLTIDSSDLSKKIRLGIKASREIIENITRDDIEIYADLSSLGEGEHNIYLAYNAPIGVIVKEIDPQPISLRLINH